MEIKFKKEQTGIPLYWMIKEKIKERICKCEYEIDSLVPSETKLIEEFDISRITAVKALNELVNEGILYRIHGKGSYVKNINGRIKEEEIVGLIMPDKGHLWQPLTQKIIQGLMGKYFCIPIYSYIKNDAVNVGEIKSFIEKNLGLLIIDGISIFPFHLLKNYKGKIIFIIFFDAEEEIKKADYILSDFYYGGKVATEHLISKGFQRIIFLTHSLEPPQKEHLSIIKGGKDALIKHNLPEENFIIFTDWENKKKIKTLLGKEKKPIAIFSESDYRAKIIYESAEELRLKIPDDISIIGYYNTPWCEIFSPRLTSISIKEDLIGSLIVKKILQPEELEKKIIIKPEIIERESVKEVKRYKK